MLVVLICFLHLGLCTSPFVSLGSVLFTRVCVVCVCARARVCARVYVCFLPPTPLLLLLFFVVVVFGGRGCNLEQALASLSSKI